MVQFSSLKNKQKSVRVCAHIYDKKNEKMCRKEKNVVV